MKTRVPVSALALLPLLAFTTPLFAAPPDEETMPETFEPKEYALSRYDHLRKKSPFEFDPPPVAVTKAINHFDGVSLAGYCGSGDTLTVYLEVSTGKETSRVTVYGDGSPFRKKDDKGFRIVGINRGKSLLSTEVILEKDGQQAPVKFDEDGLRPKATAATGKTVLVPDGDGKLVPTNMQTRKLGGIKPPVTTPPPPTYTPPPVFFPGQTQPAGVTATPNTPAAVPTSLKPNIAVPPAPGRRKVSLPNP